MKKNLSLSVVTPRGVILETECFSVNLIAADNSLGTGGGSVGIMHGHLPAVIVLKNPSDVTIKSESGENRITVNGGFCEVKDNNITIITEKA